MNDSRLEELNTPERNTSVSKGYTRFVKWMRFVLPLVALGLMAVVITWPEMEDKVVIMDKEDIIPSSESDIGQTELLNPHFETTDKNQQPVNVTAARALQNQENSDIVKLEQPKADMKMKNGSNVHIQALKGTYEQEAEKLFLENDVRVKHESGYELLADELRVDMKTREAFSDKDVQVQGPEAHIEATGLQGNVDDGLLIFKGPAKLTLSPKEKNVSEEGLKEDMVTGDE
jgi:lipopolysaccharide export system protein LptC